MRIRPIEEGCEQCGAEAYEPCVAKDGREMPRNLRHCARPTPEELELLYLEPGDIH